MLWAFDTPEPSTQVALFLGSMQVRLVPLIKTLAPLHPQVLPLAPWNLSLHLDIKAEEPINIFSA